MQEPSDVISKKMILEIHNSLGDIRSEMQKIHFQLVLDQKIQYVIATLIGTTLTLTIAILVTIHWPFLNKMGIYILAQFSQQWIL